MVIRLCTDVLVSVQRNEVAIVRLLTVSARFSGKGMAAVCYCSERAFMAGCSRCYQHPSGKITP